MIMVMVMKATCECEAQQHEQSGDFFHDKQILV
jgi:hypothetical protein